MNLEEMMTPEEIEQGLNKVHDQLLNQFENQKNFLQTNFLELEDYFKQQDCIPCRAFFLHHMNKIIGLIEEVLLLQSGKHKDEHH